METLLGMGHGDRSTEIAGIATAIALLALARLLLVPSSRHRARLPFIYLVLALGFGVGAALVDDRASLGRILHFFYTLFLLASTGRSLVLLAVDVVVGRRTHRAPPKIFRDLTQAVVYVIVVMLTLRDVGVEPGSILTTSALLTAVVGLSLQDTLGNMVSGLALQMQRPFQVGDWIQFDPDPRQIGQVTEVNWRATTVMTSDLVEVIVPNALLAKNLIRNYSRPSPVSRRTIAFHAPSNVSPTRVHDAILSAIGATPVLQEPAASVQTRGFGESGIEYVVNVFIDDFASRDAIDGIVRDRVWYALQRAAIALPFATRTVHMHAVTDQSAAEARGQELERRDHVLRCVDFLSVLPPASHRALAAAAVVRLYAPGEIIVREGEASGELFIIDRGEVVVELARERGAKPLVRLGPKKFFGEMGLMTGEARKASVRAVGECEVLVIGHEAFHGVLASAPGVVERIGELLIARQAELDAAVSSRTPTVEPSAERSKRLISQIKDFFKV